MRLIVLLLSFIVIVFSCEESFNPKEFDKNVNYTSDEIFNIASNLNLNYFCEKHQFSIDEENNRKEFKSSISEIRDVRKFFNSLLNYNELLKFK